MTTILNLGCGTRTSPNCINVDWSPLLRVSRSPFGRLLPLLIGTERAEQARRQARDIAIHDLTKGVPWATGSVDAVYSSHVLEHLDRWVAPAFLDEVHRVLRTGGVLRIVVPDLETMTRDYLASLERVRGQQSTARAHEQAEISGLIEQMVRRESRGLRSRGSRLRRLETLLMGDARRRGETHQWMYDESTLGSLLAERGFTAVRRCDFSSSSIPSWHEIDLDRDASGGEYKPRSLYLEATKQ